MRPFAGQTMGIAVAIRSVLFIWAVVVTRLTAGQETLLTTRHHENPIVTEIRLDSRAIRWMDFSKPERPSHHALHQVKAATHTHVYN